MDGNGSEHMDNGTHYYGNRSEIDEVYYEEFLVYYDCRVKMCTFVFGPLIILGLVGNVISFVIWGKMTHQHAISFLLRALAVFDSWLLLGMLVRVFTDMSATKFYVDGWLYTTAHYLGPYTETYIYQLKYMALVASVLTSVSIGMNRYIVVCRPLQAARLCTISRAKKQIIFITTVSVLIMLPSFFERKVRKTSDGSPYLVYTLLANKWYYYIWYLGTSLVCGTLIPFSILLFICVRIITTLRATRKQQLDRHGDRVQDSSVTSMVLVLLGIFLMCHTYSWLHILCTLLLPENPYWYKVLSYAYMCKEVLIIFNSAINWVIYFVYVKEFRRTLCKGCNRRQEGPNEAIRVRNLKCISTKAVTNGVRN